MCTLSTQLPHSIHISTHELVQLRNVARQREKPHQFWSVCSKETASNHISTLSKVLRSSHAVERKKLWLCSTRLNLNHFSKAITWNAHIILLSVPWWAIYWLAATRHTAEVVECVTVSSGPLMSEVGSTIHSINSIYPVQV